MSRIFISHSSRDNAAAVALNDWLRTNGWDEVFLDLDPERGIKAGERWERALHEAADRCQAVIFLVSHNWLASDWCGKEFDLAAKLDKRMFGVLIDDLAIGDIPPRFKGTWQFTPLSAGQDHEIHRAIVPPDDREEHVTFSRKGLRKLNGGLQAAGLEPRFFAWPPPDDLDRPPYSGLPPMEEADAGIFFGREADIVRALDELRGLARKAPPRLFVIEGASGCGKSSFLRAGLIPRLKRDDRNYLVLPPIRPEQAAIDGSRGFVSALTTGFAEAGLPRDRADLRALVTAPDELEAALADLAARKRVPTMPGEAEQAPPAIVIPVDQAEELFQFAGRDQGRRLIDLLASLARSKAVRVVVVFTIRTDDYEPLQTAAAFEAMPQHIFGLAPIPIGRLGAIIEGPARRLTESEHTKRTLTIEPALVVRLLKDLQEGAAADVMPLCAFILQRLWREYGGDGKLKLDEYESAERGLGGIRGAIEGAVAAAFAKPQQEPAIPADPVKREALLRRAMIPALAAIDPETRTPRRRVARLSEIPSEAQPLIERLIAARLLSTDRDPETKERTVEPAHEALLRQWSLMETWLEEDARELLVLDGIERAASDWDENGRSKTWLVHAGGRLEDAERLRQRPDFASRFAGVPAAYLDDCRAAETARRDKELDDVRRIAAEQEARAEAESARAEEEEARAAAEKAGAEEARRRTRAIRIGLVASLVLLAVALGTSLLAVKNSYDAGTAAEAERIAARQAKARQLIAEAVLLQRDIPGAEAEKRAAALTIESWRRYPTLAAAQAARISFKKLPLSIIAQVEHDEEVLDIDFSPMSNLLATASADGTVLIVDISNGREIAKIEHDEPVLAVAFSSVGDRLATGSADGTARIVNMSNGREIARIEHGGRVTDVTFSAKGDWLATASADGTARVIDAEDGQEFTTIEHGGGLFGSGVTAVAFSPAGDLVATAGQNFTARVVAFAEDREIARIKHLDFVLDVAFSADGDRLATASRDGTAQIVAVNGREIARIKHGDIVWDVAFSPDGDHFATASADGTARIVDADDGSEIIQINHGGRVNDILSPSRFTAVAFSPDGERLAIASDDGAVRMVATPDGREIARTEHGSAVWNVVFSPDGERLATASADGEARVSDAMGKLEIARIELDSLVRGGALNPEGDRIATASPDGTVRILGISSKRQVARVEHGAEVWAIAFSPEGDRLATASEDGTVQIVDASNGREIARVDHGGSVTDVAFSSKDDRLAIAGANGIARIVDAEHGREIARIEHGGSVAFVAFSPEGDRIATASTDGTVRILDASNGREIARVDHGGSVTDVAFSSKDDRLAIASANGIASIVDAEHGHEIARIEHGARVHDVAFSPDGAQLATSSRDRTARIVDAAEGREIARIEHGAEVWAVAFSPEGDRLATASEDGTARIVDAAEGREIARVKHGAGVWGVVFSPGGDRLATASYDGTARIWLSPELVFERLCDAREGRNLNVEEWTRHIGPIEDWAPTCKEWRSDPVLFAAWEAGALEEYAGEEVRLSPLEEPLVVE